MPAHFLAPIFARLLQFDAPGTPLAYTLAKYNCDLSGIMGICFISYTNVQGMAQKRLRTAQNASVDD